MIKSFSWFGRGSGQSSKEEVYDVKPLKRRTISRGQLSRKISSNSLRDGRKTETVNENEVPIAEQKSAAALQGEIDDLRRQLREAQEASKREEESKAATVDRLVRQQLEKEQESSRKSLEGEGSNQDAEAVDSALTYLNQVINRISNNKPSIKRNSSNTSLAALNDTSGRMDHDATPRKGNKKVIDISSYTCSERKVQLEFCPSLNHDPITGVSKRNVTPPPGLSASDTSLPEYAADGDNSGSWQAAGQLKHIADEMSSIASSSVVSSLHTDTDGMSSAMVTAHESTVAAINTIASDSWMTAGDDAFDDDMCTFVSALSAHTGARSRANTAGTAGISISTRDDSAVVVAELYRIQSLLCSVLKAKEGNNEHITEETDQPSLKRIATRAKIIGTLYERHLDEDNVTEHTMSQEEDRSKPVPLTKENAEKIVSSLAGIFSSD